MKQFHFVKQKEIKENSEMKSSHSTIGMRSIILFLSWMVGFVTPTSVRGIASKISSLGDSDNVMLNELKDIVLLLSQKLDDSDDRIQSLEDKVSAQQRTITSLENDINEASSFNRYLQSTDSDCLPRFVDTAFGPRCDFSYVTRFQNRTFFNGDVVFNENVEFDSDANCMPTYNSTTQMCTMSNNFTFDDGDIIFDEDVRFDDDVIFNDDVRFRDTVSLESDVEFNNGGEVTFRKATTFRENVLIQNDVDDIELSLAGKVTARFYQDAPFKIDTDTTFYKGVTFEEDVVVEKDLDVKGNLEVEHLAELHDVDIYGYLWVGETTHLDGALTANDGADISGLTELNNLKANRATVGGEKVPKAIADIVDDLMDYKGIVTIPDLTTIDLNVINTVQNNRPIQGSITIDGKKVATMAETRKLERRVEKLENP